MKNDKILRIYTDGGCSGNQNDENIGGWGAILEFAGHRKELYGGEINTTNNRMELMAVIAGLEALNRPCEVDVYSDSKYVVDAFNQHWIDNWVKKNWNRGKAGMVKNIDLWKRLLAAKEPHQVIFHWVKGHDGHAQNERCDQLATGAADGEGLIIDEGLE